MKGQSDIISEYRHITYNLFFFLSRQLCWWGKFSTSPDFFPLWTYSLLTTLFCHGLSKNNMKKGVYNLHIIVQLVIGCLLFSNVYLYFFLLKYNYETVWRIKFSIQCSFKQTGYSFPDQIFSRKFSILQETFTSSFMFWERH